MSYDVYFTDDSGKCVTVDRFTEGGTYACGGTNEASLNITYNYSEVYRLFEFSIKDLEGKRGSDVVASLSRMVERLGTRKYLRDYWAPTPGNAGFALSILLDWARQYPDAVFRVS